MKQLNYLETMKAELRALCRLKKKELISGPFINENGQCCAVGALDAHLGNKNAFPKLLREMYYSHKVACNGEARSALIQTNEYFHTSINSPAIRRARYQAVYDFVVNEIKRLTGKKPVFN